MTKSEKAQGVSGTRGIGRLVKAVYSMYVDYYVCKGNKRGEEQMVSILASNIEEATEVICGLYGPEYTIIITGYTHTSKNYSF